MDRSKLAAMFSDEPLPDLLAALDKNSDDKQLIQLLDQELVRRSDLLRELQMFRNTLCSAVHKLPAEILSLIFVYYAQDSATSRYLVSTNWRMIMRVCRKWNHVVKSTPELWSYFLIGPMFLRRDKNLWERQRRYSGSAPISVKLHLLSDNGDSARFLQQYQPFFWKPEGLRSLEVHGPIELLVPLFARMAEYSHPALQTLDVLVNRSSGLENAEAEAQNPLFTVPEALLSRRSPQLRHLVLQNCTLEWALVRDLHSLKWKLHPSRLHDVALHMSDVAQALLRCPKLYALETALPIPAPHGLPDLPLPQLAEAELIGAHESCVQLLLAMKIPATARLSLDARSLHRAHEFLPLALRLRLHFRRPGSETMRSLVFESYSLHQVSTPPLMAKVCSKTDGPEIALGENSILQLAAYPISLAEMRRMIVKLLHALPVDTITHLNCRSVLTFTHRTWKMIILNLPALRTISVRPTWSFSPLLSALWYFLRTKKRTPVHRIIINTTFLSDRWQDTGNQEELEESRAAARTLFGWLVEYAAEANKEGIPLAVIDVTGGWNGILGDLEAKDVYEHLSEGLFLGLKFINKEGAKRIKERRGLDGPYRGPSDSDSDSD